MLTLEDIADLITTAGYPVGCDGLRDWGLDDVAIRIESLHDIAAFENTKSFAQVTLENWADALRSRKPFHVIKSDSQAGKANTQWNEFLSR